MDGVGSSWGYPRPVVPTPSVVSPVSGLLLTPGAGSNRDHPGLVALEDRLAPLPVERMDFPYRKAGRHFPDRAPVLVQAAVVVVAILGIDLLGPDGVAPFIYFAF